MNSSRQAPCAASGCGGVGTDSSKDEQDKEAGKGGLELYLEVPVCKCPWD